MLKKTIRSLTLVTFATCLYFSQHYEKNNDKALVSAIVIHEQADIIKTNVDIVKSFNDVISKEQQDDSIEVVETQKSVEEFPLSSAEIELIALVTMAEAEGECEEGKRLVIDTILNRLDSCDFPDTVEGVVYQPGHFSSMWNGRVNKCYVRDDICQIVKEELMSRTNTDVVFFTSGHYGKYGTPMFSVGNHYFSSY